jgi:hypothetical protein
MTEMTVSTSPVDSNGKRMLANSRWKRRPPHFCQKCDLEPK